MTHQTAFDLPLAEVERLIASNKLALTPENRNTIFGEMTRNTIQHLENVAEFKRMFPK